MSRIPITRASPPASNLVAYWNEARLRVSSAKFGVSDDSVFKHDRLNVAWSHGHTTILED
jgi:hypothetical protein